MEALEKTRKLQFIGNTFYIGIPREWVKHHKLKKGDKLKVEYSDEPDIKFLIPETGE